jgi:hypothetical protein
LLVLKAFCYYRAMRKGGRKKGTPNKITASLREMIQTALSEEGGVSYLRRIARDEPVAFCGLLGRILPLQVEASKEPLVIVTRME